MPYPVVGFSLLSQVPSGSLPSAWPPGAGSSFLLECLQVLLQVGGCRHLPWGSSVGRGRSGSCATSLIVSCAFSSPLGVPGKLVWCPPHVSPVPDGDSAPVCSATATPMTSSVTVMAASGGAWRGDPTTTNVVLSPTSAVDPVASGDRGCADVSAGSDDAGVRSGLTQDRSTADQTFAVSEAAPVPVPATTTKPASSTTPATAPASWFGTGESGVPPRDS